MTSPGVDERQIRGPKGLLVERSSRLQIPLTAILELTHRCNEKCVHCYVIQPEGKSDFELSTAEWKNILSQLASEGTMEVTFTGGEPFLRPDLLEIIAEARRLNFAIKLSTNATMVGPKEAEELGRLKLWEVGVSLYAGQGDIHDAITAIPGSFGRTVEGIRLMIARGVKVKIRNVLMKENYDYQKGLSALARKLGASFAQDPLLTPLSSGSRENLVHRLDRDQLRDSLIEDSEKLFSAYDAQRWESIKLDKLHSNMCKAGVNFLSINPKGQVLPCIQFQLIAGNLREQTFREIWHTSQVFQKLRRTVNMDLERCRDCDLIPICFRCPGEALLADGNAYAPSSWACLRSKLLEEIHRKKLEDS